MCFQGVSDRLLTELEVFTGSDIFNRAHHARDRFTLTACGTTTAGHPSSGSGRIDDAMFDSVGRMVMNGLRNGCTETMAIIRMNESKEPFV